MRRILEALCVHSRICLLRGPYALVVAIAGISIPVFPLAAQPPNISSVVNLASGQYSLSPGTLAAIFGDNLDLQQPSTVPLSITVNNIAAALLSRSPQQLTVQLPVEASSGPAIIRTNLQGSLSNFFPVQLQNFAPGIFTGTGTLGAIFHLDGSPVTVSSPAQPGEGLSLLATGLGPTFPQIGTGIAAPSAPLAITTTMPTVSVDGQNAPVQQAALQAGSIGKYQVLFSVPSTLSAGSHALSLSIGGITSNSVTLMMTGQGLPAVNSVVNAASFKAGPVAPGSIVSIFGLNFGELDNRGLFPSTDYQGLSVSFNSVPAPIFAVVPAAGQINALVPDELQGFGAVTAVVTSAAGASQSVTIQLAPTAPGIFRITDPSKVINNNAAVLFANTAWLVVPASLASALEIPGNCSASGIGPGSICGQPARAGDFLQIFVTGLGQATAGGDPDGPILPTGTTAPADGNPTYETLETPLVRIGGHTAHVLFSGIAPGFAGLYQINVQVPQGVPVGDQVSLNISTANGLGDTATIAIQP